MTWRVSNKDLNDMFGALKTNHANGALFIYSGSQPASSHAAPTGTLLGIATNNAGAWAAGSPTNGINFDTPANREMTKAAAETWQFVALVDGVAGWARFKGNAADPDTLDATETYPRIDGRISTTTGSEFTMATTTVVAGATYTIESGYFRWPANVL